MVAKALTIAGSDSGGGAGIQADIKTFSAMNVYGASVVTAVTAQNTKAVTAIYPIPEEVVAAQIRTVLDDMQIDAVKIGMLGTPSLIATVADALEGYKGPIVLDPVMVAKSGDSLLADSAIHSLKSSLFARATLLTPNLPETVKLVGKGSTEKQAKALLALGVGAVLIKGGHADGRTCTDHLFSQTGTQDFSAQRVDTRNTHGTGCSYSSAIAAGLAQGMALGDSVSRAHAWLHQAILHADELNVGQGQGPVHHFHGLWK